VFVFDTSGDTVPRADNVAAFERYDPTMLKKESLANGASTTAIRIWMVV
jgi:hypothetical protein